MLKEIFVKASLLGKSDLSAAGNALVLDGDNLIEDGSAGLGGADTDYASVTVSIGQSLDSETNSPSFRSLNSCVKQPLRECWQYPRRAILF